jgi:tetratricopeptide (TPR) repeat protein
MKLLRNAKLDLLMKELNRAFALQEAGKHLEAFKAYGGVLEAQQRLGVASGFTLWNLAMTADNMGELEMAFSYAVQAIETDPLAVPFRNAFDFIARRIREALAAEGRAADDPSTPRLYELLVNSGEADLTAHATMARYCAATGDHARGRTLAEAVTTLFPAEGEAWLCRAEVARAAGDQAQATACAAEAAARDAVPVPFSVPGVALG